MKVLKELVQKGRNLHETKVKWGLTQEEFNPRLEVIRHGYDRAKKMGFLEVYLDAWGFPTFPGREEGNWEKKWLPLIS